ncbi:MAG: GAF domain-containing protein [Dehalococcoidia bacterium]|nr:GAF domain-containing protein [Dehalococcoidia bacterium]MCZ7578216.1 GAF domain-containing protein [Dehalococcoidia bacterium]
MLHVVVRSEGQERAFDHGAGPLEFGRGPAHDVRRCFMTDPFVSRDHLRLEEDSPGRLAVENLSGSSNVRLADGRELATGQSTLVDLPVVFSIGHSEVEVAQAPAPAVPAPPATPAETVQPVPVATGSAPPAARARTTLEDHPLPPGVEVIARPPGPATHPVALHELGETPGPEVLAHWFETLVSVQQAAATSAEFLDSTARAIVDLVGLDRGLVLLRQEGKWAIGASFPADPGDRSPYSSTIVNEVLRLRQTVYRNLGPEFLSSSLVGVDTVVAAPVLDPEGEVAGIVYGARSLRPNAPPPRITMLEALVVQVLAAAAGAGLEREEQRERAIRSQVQFEQFFSPELARELALDASLLEGREREVTVLFSDVRNFSRISENLGPQRTFVMMQEVMELQSQRIRETDGVVVDYVGDGLLAMWNAPTDQPDHAVRACSAAIAFLGDLPALSARWETEAHEPIRLGVGIHTGPALVGNTGSRVKFKYGPMGPAVNLASRLENATKSVGVRAIISGAARDRLPDRFATRRLGSLRVQGFAEPVGVFELFPGAPTPEWKALRDSFELALAHFEAREWSEACGLLAGLLARGPDYDIPSLQLLSRAVECLRSRPEPFDPAMTIQKQA